MTTPAEIARCETCKWWGGRISGQLAHPGRCRRYPPDPKIGLPLVTYDDFCGEHFPRDYLTKGKDDE